MKKLLALLAITGLTGCALEAVSPETAEEKDILKVHNDGTMEFRDRHLSDEDVVIYPDGFGGERAAIKMRVPLKDSDFYRDSIKVHRIDAETTVTQK